MAVPQVVVPLVSEAYRDAVPSVGRSRRYARRAMDAMICFAHATSALAEAGLQMKIFLRLGVSPGSFESYGPLIEI